MGSPVPRPNDLGIVFDKNGAGTGTYVDIAGVTQAAGTLTGSYTEQVTVPLGNVDYSHPWVGARIGLSLFVEIGRAGTVTFSIKLQGRYDGAGGWADLQTVDESTGTVAVEHTFTAAGTYCLQTSSALAVSQLRVQAKGVSGGALVAGDYVVVRGWME